MFVEVSPALSTVVVDFLGGDESRRTDDAMRGGGLGRRGLQGRRWHPAQGARGDLQEPI